MDAPAGPACTACGAPAVVHWQRRLNADETTTQQAIEQDRRRAAAPDADPAKPAPVLPPMPDFLDATTPVYGCLQHSISLDAASRTHQAACTAPPSCNCTPDVPPESEQAPVALPAGW